MLGWAGRQLMVMAGLSLLLYWAATHVELWLPANPNSGPAPVPAPARVPAAPALAAPVEVNTLTLRADRHGQFWANGVVNGGSVRFLVDTGASHVALRLQDAQAAGISRSSLAFTIPVETANGRTFAAPVRLREVRIGQLTINDVPALVQESLPFSLLGTNFLRRLQSYDVRSGALTLSW